jgi:hypothetical protein
MSSSFIPADTVSQALLAIAALLLMIVLVEITGIMSGPAATGPQTVDESASLPGISSASPGRNKYPSLRSYSEILSRPLYEETRKPMQTQPPAKENGSADRFRKKWRLSGIIMDVNNIAIVETIRAGETHSLIAGQSFDGWRVQEISATELVVIRGGESLRFALYKEGTNIEGTNAPIVARNRKSQMWKPSNR